MAKGSDKLPGLLSIVADVGGLDAAVALVMERGGRYAHIPLRAGPEHWLVRTVGRAAADAVMKIYGNEGILVPNGAGLKRRLDAAKALSEAKSYSEAAAASGLHWRSVARIAKKLNEGGTLVSKRKRRTTKPAADDRQIDLEDYLKKTT